MTGVQNKLERLWGGWHAEPHPTVDLRMFAGYYHRDPRLWERAFTFLKGTDFNAMPAGVYNLDPGNLIIMVQEYITREISETQYEAHQIFADIQYVAQGAERIGIANLERTRIVRPYDSREDIVFLHAVDEQVHRASQDNFFIFFPEHAHRPCMKDDSCGSVKKIVVKLRLRSPSPEVAFGNFAHLLDNII